MAYDEILAQRIRLLLGSRPGYSDKAMFGGMCYLINGNMCAGVVRNELMLRVGSELQSMALAQPHTRPMDFTGRPMKGMLYVAPPGFASDELLKQWLELAADYVATLPAKPAKGARRKSGSAPASATRAAGRRQPPKRSQAKPASRPSAGSVASPSKKRRSSPSQLPVRGKAGEGSKVRKKSRASGRKTASPRTRPAARSRRAR